MGHFFFLDSPKWEKTAREDAFLISKARKTLQKRAASGKSKGAVRFFGQPLYHNRCADNACLSVY